MRKLIALLMVLAPIAAAAGEFAKVPSAWKWISDDTICFSDGESHFSVQAPFWTRVERDSFPMEQIPSSVAPEDAVNPTYSPDSTMIAYTRGGDLFVYGVASGKETRLTFDGSETVYNGYASWVYYEEIFGRPSRYRAFWWSPDSGTLAFYRFDDSKVPMFPIYSPFGQDGSLRRTRYPKAGEPNPEVKIGFVDVRKAVASSPIVVWADFDPSEDQYFGTPFWGADSKSFFVAREPRIQNTLDLYDVNPSNGAKKPIYHETYPTWLDWMEGMLFGKDGLYMVRSFETGWQQIYFLSYDGSTLKRLTDGTNWKITLLRLGDDGTVYFTARRDSKVRSALYSCDPKGRITALTDPSLNVSRVMFSPDGKYFAAAVSALRTPTQVWLYSTRYAPRARETGKNRYAKYAYKAADAAGDVTDFSEWSLPELVTIDSDSHELPATIALPYGFDPSKKYPVHVDIYGGPDTPMVHDRWTAPTEANQWYAANGIIQVVADCRAAGHDGRSGLDEVYLHLGELETKDFVAWSDYLKSLPYVDGDKIGVEGFSFGGTMTSLLVITHPEAYHYGIAGGGVYDWALYDTHYTERFMSTPQLNPDGYAASRVISKASLYPVRYPSDGSVMLKITHGTGDDNVHFQNTLQLIDALHREGAEFEFMIYPDGMHGYRGYQGQHFLEANRAFWLKYLKGE